jgi:hypothetical protein
MATMSRSRRRSFVWTVLLLAAGAMLLAGAAYHARQHMHGPPPHPRQRTAATDVNRIASWMTLRYVSRAYGVPEPVLLRAVQLDFPHARLHTLGGIAATKGVPTQTVLTEVRDAVRQYRETNPGRAIPAPRPTP